MLVLLLLGGCTGHGWVCHNDADADNTLLFSYDAANNTVTVGGGPTHHRNASWVRRLETGDWGAYLEHDQQVQLCQDRQGTPPCRLTNSIYRYRFDHATGTLRYRLSYQPPQPAWPPLEINYTCTRSATLLDRVVTGAGRHW